MKAEALLWVVVQPNAVEKETMARKATTRRQMRVKKQARCSCRHERLFRSKDRNVVIDDCVGAGATRRFLDCDDKKFGALERDKNVIADLPINYGKPPEYKYHKGVSREWQDIKPVNKGDLISVIKKCHQTLCGGGRLSPPAAFGEFCKIIFVKVRDEKAMEVMDSLRWLCRVEIKSIFLFGQPGKRLRRRKVDNIVCGAAANADRGLNSSLISGKRNSP